MGGRGNFGGLEGFCGCGFGSQNSGFGKMVGQLRKAIYGLK